MVGYGSVNALMSWLFLVVESILSSHDLTPGDFLYDSIGKLMIKGQVT